VQDLSFTNLLRFFHHSEGFKIFPGVDPEKQLYDGRIVWDIIRHHYNLTGPYLL
jgi:hypothetical protein